MAQAEFHYRVGDENIQPHLEAGVKRAKDILADKSTPPTSIRA
jgi:hypothetical protein